MAYTVRILCKFCKKRKAPHSFEKEYCRLCGDLVRKKYWQELSFEEKRQEAIHVYSEGTYIVCLECGKRLRRMTHIHLSTCCNSSVAQYHARFPEFSLWSQEALRKLSSYEKTNEWRQRIREGNVVFNKRNPEFQKEKGRRPEVREALSRSGKKYNREHPEHRTEVMNRSEVRDTMRTVMGIVSALPENREKNRRGVVRYLASDRRKWQDTSIELICDEILKELQEELSFDVRKQFPVRDRYAIDRALIFEDRVICVEAYGDFWHDFQNRSNSIRSDIVCHDLTREKMINEVYSLVILWEHDLNSCRELCKSVLLDAIANRAIMFLDSFEYLKERRV